MSSKKVAPSTELTKLIEVLQQGGQGELDGAALLGHLAQLGGQLVIQEALEKEQAEYIGRERYERHEPGRERLHRNGYEAGRLVIGEGAIELRRPQVREGSEPYRSRLWELLSTRSEAVERLVVEMYARGLSTREIEDLFRAEDGEVLLSKSAVSELTDRLWAEYEALASATCRLCRWSTWWWTASTRPCTVSGRSATASWCRGASWRMAGGC